MDKIGIKKIERKKLNNPKNIRKRRNWSLQKMMISSHGTKQQIQLTNLSHSVDLHFNKGNSSSVSDSDSFIFVKVNE